MSSCRPISPDIYMYAMFHMIIYSSCKFHCFYSCLFVDLFFFTIAKRFFRTCILVTIAVLLILFLIFLAPFIYFLIKPVSYGTTHHFLYTPINTQVAALVDCFDPKTSEISVSTVSNNDFNVSLHKIQKDRLQVNPVQLQDKTITGNGFVTLPGHSSYKSNYYFE